MLDNTNQDASDSNNGKLNYHYADLIEKEKLPLQNLFKNTKIEPEEKIGKKGKIGVLFKKQEKIGTVLSLMFTTSYRFVNNTY